MPVEMGLLIDEGCDEIPEVSHVYSDESSCTSAKGYARDALKTLYSKAVVLYRTSPVKYCRKTYIRKEKDTKKGARF